MFWVVAEVGLIVRYDEVDEVSLIWDYNGECYGCFRDGWFVDCCIDGDCYIWLIEVGFVVERLYRIKVVDCAGNTVISPIWMVYVVEILDIVVLMVTVLEFLSGIQ